MGNQLNTGTCIVAAVQKDGSILMGADTQATGGNLIYHCEKLFILTGHLFAMTGSVRTGQIIQYTANIPEPPPSFDQNELQAHLVRSVVPAIQAALRAAKPKDSDKDEKYGNDNMSLALLVGVNGHTFSIGSDFSVIPFPKGYAADGCGGDLALGVLTDKSKSKKYLTKKDLEAALKAAASNDAFCNDRLTFKTLKLPTVVELDYGEDE